MSQGIFRKRERDLHRPHDPWSTRLQQLRELVYRHQPRGLFDAVNRELAHTHDPTKQAQLLSLVGDCQAEEGDFTSAVATYDRAAGLVTNDPSRWFRPVLGAIGALLKNVQVEEAEARAQAALTRARAFQQRFTQEVAKLEAQTKDGGLATVTARPPSATVVAIRLGRLFFLEGEMEKATALFEEALSISPEGAMGARVGLAEIALRDDRPQDAKDWAFRALEVGQFHAKTIAAIPVLLEACYQLGEQTLDPALISGFEQATPKVRDRAMLAIVRSLCCQNNPSWKDLALAWLANNSAQNPVVTAELNKLLQAVTRIDSDLTAQLSAADALLNTPKLSPTEFISAAKQRVRSGLLLEQDVDLNGLVNLARDQYGTEWRAPVIHGLALACMMSRRHDLARPLLQSNIEDLPSTDSNWGKSLWALARMEDVLGNYTAAAECYDRFAREADVPLRYRLEARLKWLSSILASGDPVSVTSVRDDLIAATNEIQDFDLLLDFARQLIHAPEGVQDLADDLLTRGVNLALAKFDSAKDPSEALSILFRLTRRQVYDFGQYDVAVANWNNLNLQQRDWLWSQKSEFWEYIGYVYTAMIKLHHDSEAEALLDQYLTDLATPPEGCLQLMRSRAVSRINSRSYAEALSIFASMISLAPTHRLCAEAYYWLALAAKKNGNDNECVHYARKIQIALGSRKGLLSEWELDCKAALLRSNLIVATSFQSANYTADFQANCLASVRSDLEDLSL